MALKVLISDPFDQYSSLAKEILLKNSYVVDVALNGKDAQLKCYQTKYYAVILDIDTTNHSGFEVLRYIRVNRPSVRIILTFESAARMEYFEMTRDDLLKLGVSDVLIKPYNHEKLMKSISGELQYKLFKNVKAGPSKNVEAEPEAEEMFLRDDLFTKIKIDSFFSGNASIFDLFIKLTRNKYLKILHAGDFFSTDRIKKYKEEKNVDYLYFKTKDRAVYIQFYNKFLKLLLKRPDVALELKVTTIKSLSEKYLEEIHTEGLKPHLVEEGKGICDNIYHMVGNEKKLFEIIKKMEQDEDQEFNHSFLVAFFASLICKHMDWGSEKTINNVVFGGFLHDIGKTRIRRDVQTLTIQEMNIEQLAEYKTHPVHGGDILAELSTISSEVKQIVLQHHELVDGSGFPAGLFGMKIFPLAKVIGFADACTRIMSNQKVNPIQCVKQFLKEPGNVLKYDKSVIAAFVACLTDTTIEI